MTATVRRRNAVGGMLHLVRLVLDESWHPASAATRLRGLIGDDRVLRQMAVRVRSALADRPSPVGERAALTLAVAIDPIVTDWRCPRPA